MRKVINVIYPKVLDKYAQKLILNNPFLWSTRIHKLIFWGMSSLILNLLFVSFIPIDIDVVPIRINTVVIISGICSILIFIYWMYTQAMFNISLHHGILKGFHHIKISIVFILVVVYLLIIMIVPVAYYTLRLKSGILCSNLPKELDYYYTTENFINFVSENSNLSSNMEIALHGLRPILSDYRADTFVIKIDGNNKFEVYLYNTWELKTETIECLKLSLDVLNQRTDNDFLYDSIQIFETPVKVVGEDTLYMILKTYRIGNSYFDKFYSQYFLLKKRIEKRFNTTFLDSYDFQKDIEFKSINRHLDSLYANLINVEQSDLLYSQQNKNYFDSILVKRDSLEKLDEYIYNKYYSYDDIDNNLNDMSERSNIISNDKSNRAEEIFLALRAELIQSTERIFYLPFFSLLIILCLGYFLLNSIIIIKYFGFKRFLVGIVFTALFIGIFLFIKYIIMVKFTTIFWTKWDIVFGTLICLFPLILCLKIRNVKLKIQLTHILVYFLPLFLLLIFLVKDSINTRKYDIEYDYYSSESLKTLAFSERPVIYSDFIGIERFLESDNNDSLKNIKKLLSETAIIIGICIAYILLIYFFSNRFYKLYAMPG